MRVCGGGVDVGDDNGDDNGDDKMVLGICSRVSVCTCGCVSMSVSVYDMYASVYDCLTSPL